jgi:hypothetical protein
LEEKVGPGSLVGTALLLAAMLVVGSMVVAVSTVRAEPSAWASGVKSGADATGGSPTSPASVVVVRPQPRAAGAVVNARAANNAVAALGRLRSRRISTTR